MEAVAEYLRSNTSRIDGRWRITTFVDDLPQILTECYKAECSKRGMDAIIDDDTKSHIDNMAYWLTKSNRVGVMMLGEKGNGKTTMTRAVQTLISMLYGRGGSGYAKLEIVSALDMAKMAASKPDEFERIKKAKLLAIDDVGIEEVVVKNFGNVLSPLTDIIYHRYDKMLFTMMSSNLSYENLGLRYGGRIADRFKEMFAVISFTNDSYRK